MKKNHCELISGIGKIWKFKKFRKMRIVALLLLISITQTFALDAYAQNKRLNLNVKSETIVTILGKIENQSDFYFMYDASRINVNQRKSIDCENQSITHILDKLFENTGIKYSINDRQVLLTTGKSNSEQQKSISGKVTDSSNSPLPGVTVVLKGTTQGTITDMDGNYSLTNVSSDATLVFSFVGMATQEIPVAGKSSINVVMEEDAIGIEEVVAVGYGTMRKSDLTGSVVRADIQTFENQPNISIVESLQGTTPGLNVGAVNRPGQDASLSIRGQNTFSGTTAPLIVLDGVIYRGSLIELNQNDIESVDILKDASSKAIYGSQAANGVMIITSKSGKKSKEPVFNFSSYYATQTPSNIIHPLNREEYLEKVGNYYYQDSYLAPDYVQLNPNYNVAESIEFPEIIEGYNNGTNTNWMDLITQNGSVLNSNLSMAANTEHLTYYTSLGYTKQEGYLKNDRYEKINFRINIDNKVTSWLTLGIQSFLTTGDYSGVPGNLNTAFLLPPLLEPYNEDGSLILFPVSTLENPLVQMKVDDFDKRLNIFGNFYANINIPFVKGLSYKFNYSTNYRTRRNFQFDSYANNETGSASKSNSMTQDQTIDNLLSFKRLFDKKHAIDVTLLYGYEKSNSEGTNASVSDFTNDVLGYNAIEAGDPGKRNISSNAWEEFNIYQMGRLNYKFGNKYLATFTLRRDGFSGFGANKKYGMFPSMALAWIASNEKFIASALPWVNNLKIRASYGKNGNRTVGRYATLAKVSADYVYVFGSESAYGQAISSLANNDLGWETTTGLNVGIDFGVLNNRINATIDYYDSKTEDILFNVNLPTITGFGSVASNIGSVANNGLEVTVSSTNLKTKDFTWESTVTFSKNNNRIESILGADNDGDGKEDDLVGNKLFIGEPLGTIYDYNVLGIYQVGDEMPDIYRPGLFKIEDLNNDGDITLDMDRKILGTSNPAYRFSINNHFSYKNWSLDVFINSIQGGKNDYLENVNPIKTSGWWSQSNANMANLAREHDYWTPANPNATYSAINDIDPINPWLYKSRSFVRLQDVNLKYTFSKNIFKNAFDTFSIYLSGKNLYTWTNWVGTDPETENSFQTNALPVMKSYSLGFNLTF